MLVILTALTKMVAVGGISLGVYNEIIEPTAVAAYDKGVAIYQSYTAKDM